MRGLRDNGLREGGWMGEGPEGFREGMNGSGAHLHQTLVNPPPHGPYARFTPSLSASQRQERRAPVVCPALNCPAPPLSFPLLPCFHRLHPPLLSSSSFPRFILLIHFIPLSSPASSIPFSFHPPSLASSSFSSLHPPLPWLIGSASSIHP